MTWTFTTTPAQGGTVSATIRSPTFGDEWSSRRRQVARESDGGTLYVQDLGVEDRRLRAAWTWLDGREWSELLRLFRASEWRARPIDLTISGDSPFPLDLSTGMEHNGEEVNTGMDVCYGQELSTGMTLFASSATLPNLVLEVSETTFEHQRSRRASLALSFRIESPEKIETGG